MARILFLGASTFQVPPIQYALAKGHTVFTTDNRPDNIGHQLAHRSYTISTIDKEKVCCLASHLAIDGIVSFGSDVSAPTAAYVAEQLGLPTNSYKTVLTLTQKHLFRKFLQEESLQHITYQYFAAHQEKELVAYIATATFPLVFKPVDSSGSKGVQFLQNAVNWQAKYHKALAASIKQLIIVESFITKKGFQICGDGYMEKGKLVFIEYGNGHFYRDKRFLAPYGETFPSQHQPEHLKTLSKKLADILQKVDYQTGTFNFDAWITHNNQVFVNEIGPRSGGNFIPTVIKYNTGVDLIEAAVESSWNPNFSLNITKKRSDKYFCSYMLHSKKEMIDFQKVVFHPDLKKHIIAYHLYCKKGEQILPFYQANTAIGNIILQFEEKEKMMEMMENMIDFYEIKATKK